MIATTALEARDVGVRLEPADEHWSVVIDCRHALDLSDLLPPVEAFGFHVLDASTGTGPAGVRQRLEVRPPGPLDDDQVDRLTEALRAALSGRTATDPLLQLVATTPLTWPQVDWLRAYRLLLGLLGTSWSTASIDAALLGNPDAAWALVHLFVARLVPGGDPVDEPAAAYTLDTVREGLKSLTDDRIVADLGQAVTATLRTNAFAEDREVALSDGRTVEALALKFRSSQLPAVPSPVPHAEILVTSSVTSGVHLRGGPIARGGLRASDRDADVRDEVLSLVKAQIVKNAMIVPTGAKGGFVLHDPPADAEARPTAVADAYRVFITGLLSVTDNIVDGEVVGPPGVRRRDGDDPYLVVAADKGTARLSDTANEIAQAHDFWLGDAFASGGSAGYDHKALGITATGAWVAIARHFRELGIDIYTDEITVAGIGDMSGDVFGNGMLTSRTLRLVAAFDHRDIFLDPDPDPAASHEERRRLFELPGSSWQDYDRDLLSEGGGVFPRTAKQVELSPQVRDLLGVEDKSMAPDTLVRAILRLKVDLLYAGGIGTYVKASAEEDVGDRTNAAVRVDADEVNARVFGEGANLAITQRGRIEYARRGGRIDQDAVHNAGGVAISDREVNLKILFAPLVADGSLQRSERDDLLTEATDDVVADVSADVDAQVWLLSREHARSARRIGAYERHLERLEAEGAIDREVDVLPDADDVSRRQAANAGLTRPELATVVAATKRLLTTEVVDSNLPDQRTAAPALYDYFPTVVRDRFIGAIGEHRLAREITALRVVSGLVNRVGPTTVQEMAADFGVHPTVAVAALWAAQQVLDGNAWWRRLQGLAHEVPAETIEEVATQLVALQRGMAAALLRDDAIRTDTLDDVVAHHRAVAEPLRAHLEEEASSGPSARRRIALLDDLVPDDMAVTVAVADDLARVVDIRMLHDQSDQEPTRESVANFTRALRVVDDRLRLTDLDDAVRNHLGSEPWSRRHAQSLEADLVELRRLAGWVVADHGTETVGAQSSPVVRLRSRVTAALQACRDPETSASDVLGVAVAAARRTVGELAVRAEAAHRGGGD